MADKKINCKDWTAIHDFMPVNPGRLTVHGTCIFPTPGYTVTLTKKRPQGINPTILILEKRVKTPEGVEPDVITSVPAQYEEVTQTHYKQVQILPDETLVEVEEVH